MYYSENLRNKALTNHILPDKISKTYSKKKNIFLHLMKIVIDCSLLYYLFLCFCARNFFHIVEKSPRREKCMSCNKFRIPTSRCVWTHILIVPCVVSCIPYALGQSVV